MGDVPEPGLPPAGSEDAGGRGGSCWRPSPHRCLPPAGSPGSSRGSGVESQEMSVDGPSRTKALCGGALPCSCSASHSSGGAEDSGRGWPERDTGDEGQGDGEHVAGEPPAQSSLSAPEGGCTGLTFLSHVVARGLGPARRTGAGLCGVGGWPSCLSAADLGRPTCLAWV